MTTYYGVHDECNVIPHSCVKGSGSYFSYGHDRSTFLEDSSSTLHIIMLRDPLSWILSRIQHEIRKSNNDKIKIELLSAIATFGSRYFNFMNDQNLKLANSLFKNLIQSQSSEGSMSIPLQDGFNKQILSQLHLIESIENNFQSNILVLITEYYHESIILLDYIFNTTVFSFNAIQEKELKESHSLQPISASGATPHSFTSPTIAVKRVKKLNEAFDWQGKLSAGTFEDTKLSTKMLQIQYNVYETALREFMVQYHGMEKSPL